MRQSVADVASHHRAVLLLRDLHEEGLRIPICKLYDAGVANETVFAFIGDNVRAPEMVLTDIAAQVTANGLGAARLTAFLREYGLGAQILVDLGLKTIRLLTNNPKKVVGLEGYGLEIVEQVPIRVKPNPHNRRYLKTKREKLGHLV